VNAALFSESTGDNCTSTLPLPQSCLKIANISNEILQEIKTCNQLYGPRYINPNVQQKNYEKSKAI
jgi:hypothetical protein